jgi:hypothetical protein
VSKIKKLWRYEVEWCDSHVFLNGWQTLDTYLKHRTPRMISVGFILEDDSKGIVLAGSCDFGSGNALGVIAIPRGAILKRRRLK